MRADSSAIWLPRRSRSGASAGSGSVVSAAPCRHRGEALIGRHLSAGEGPCELLGYGRLRPSCRRRLAGKHDRVVFHDGAMVHPDFGSPVTARGEIGCGFPAFRVESRVAAGRASAARILRKKQTGSSTPRNRAPQTMSTPASTKSRIIFRFVRYPGARCRRTEGAAVRHAGRVRVGGIARRAHPGYGRPARNNLPARDTLSPASVEPALTPHQPPRIAQFETYTLTFGTLPGRREYRIIYRRSARNAGAVGRHGECA